MSGPSWASAPTGSFEETTIAAARGNPANGATPTAKTAGAATIATSGNSHRLQRAGRPASSGSARHRPGGGDLSAGGRHAGPLGGICPRAVHLPASTVAGKREPQACPGQARHQDPAGRGEAVLRPATPAVQAMNTAIAANWQVAAAQTKA